jgi:hypothetical protein
MTKASKTKKLSFPRIYGESARAVPGSGNLSATSCNRAEAAPHGKAAEPGEARRLLEKHMLALRALQRGY